MQEHDPAPPQLPPARFYRAQKERLWHFVGKAKRKIRNRTQKMGSALLRRLPIAERVVFFESHRGLSYSGNPKYITEEILARGLSIRCVWSLTNPSIDVPSGIVKVKKGSKEYYYYHACAKVLVHNGEFGQALPIRPDQVYINTQHGTPLKLMGTDILHKKPGVSGKTYGRTGRWSWLVSPNKYSSDIFKRVYEYDGPVLEEGYPRNDIFYQRNSLQDIRELKARLNLPLDKKVLLYAPTWRDVGASKVDTSFVLQLEIDELRRAFGHTHVLLLRMHHLIASKVRLDVDQQAFARDVSSANFDVQELMLISDVLITDYSSMMFDYSNLDRPIVFFTYDHEDYSNDIRGMYFDLRDRAPGPVVSTTSGVVEAISNVNDWFLRYEEKRRAFRSEFCSKEKGTASAAVVDKIVLPALGLKK